MDPKDRILLKAEELFMQFGIRSVSMDDIANNLGMSKKHYINTLPIKMNWWKLLLTDILMVYRKTVLIAEKKQRMPSMKFLIPWKGSWKNSAI
ncbi:MAG: TetR family transcriptional regulator [Chitinophagaceae bacterium]|nr:TetR family transcriptional regulator [Chitinophagaceae bacterium]